MTIASINPATGATLRTFEPLTSSDVERCVHRAVEVFRQHRVTSFAERARHMIRAAEILESESDALGRLMTVEMGKPIKAAVEEAKKCARACRFYAEHAERFLARVDVPTEAARSYVLFQPVGVVLAVMPWNFPFWQVFRFLAPALMAGNVGLLKHASNVPQCALAIEDVIRRAGFLDGVFQSLLIGSDAVPALLDDHRIAAVTLTGSEAAGSDVGARAARQIKKSVLELGGSDPYIVMPSCDLEAAIKTAVTARTINNGQSCIAAKRFIVHEQIAAEFERLFAEKMRGLRIGDPLDPATEIGPLATPQIVRDLHDQVQRSVASGARLACGGKRVDRVGNYYEPTVLVDVPRDAAVACEETFGPVAAIFRARDSEEALAIANDTPFGLGAAVWTRDARESDRFVRELQAGAVFVNGMVASDPRMPFGGVKRSGYGRELGEFGIREFVNIKTVWEQDDPAPPQPGVRNE